MQDTHLHALDYVSVVSRRKWWLVAPILTSVVVGAALVRWLPKEYRSTSTLGVTSPLVSPNFVGQSTPFDNQERLRAISQQLLSPRILARVAHDTRLDTTMTSDAAIARLRAGIDVTVPDPVASTNEPRHLDTFVVSYMDNSPAQAQRVTDRLATVFVDENSKIRTEHAEGTSNFIGTQLTASHARLDALEARLREAKEAHMGRLPEQTPANLQTLAGLRQQVSADATALRGEQDRLSVLDGQVARIGQTGTDPSVPPSADIVAADARVVSLEHELADAQTTYTPRHPEVQRLQQELAAARAAAAADAKQPAADRAARLQTDPAYRQLVTERDASRMRIAELQRSGADAQKQIALYQERVDAAPMVEQQLATVQRDFDLEKQQYADLSTKLHAATIAENVERDRSGEEFTVLYPASLPAEPTKPIPMRVMLASLLGGLCLGVGLALGREYFDRSIHDTREIKDELELPVLGEVACIAA